MRKVEERKEKTQEIENEDKIPNVMFGCTRAVHDLSNSKQRDMPLLVKTTRCPPDTHRVPIESQW
ncbi:hypothetical protein ALC53_05411 [Atta colombica]|uniref:Uncharacterized protein n=1 Tax=Atta colombica TaxID=520822 RepID=A0A195BHL8_9HYME|nr:hypothetical protein ALC53_05411 [Atta colombica]